MPHFLSVRNPDFEADFAAFLSRKREASEEVDATVRSIIADVHAQGDAALIAYTERFDGLTLAPQDLRISQAEVEQAIRSCDSEDLTALEFAADRIRRHHQRQKPNDDIYTDEIGATLGTRWTAVDAVGLYVPGGTAAYPSSVLMNAIPAAVAGVPRIVMVVPTPGGRLNPLVLAAASLAGITEIYRIGGAQAVAALAYGTETIDPVAKIVGPGNAYVAAAKRQVFGKVGIDSIAGPSEVLIIADANNDPSWIAADLLAQAEHDTAAQSILMTDDAGFADRVAAEVKAQLDALPRREIAQASWDSFGGIILVDDFDQVPPIADRIAAEHLQIAVSNSDDLAARIRNAGAIFVGSLTPEVIGDYVGGTNHVLPTARAARYASGLGVHDFMKRTSVLKLDAASLDVLGPAAVRLARAEGLEAHARSVAIRLGRNGQDD